MAGVVIAVAATVAFVGAIFGSIFRTASKHDQAALAVVDGALDVRFLGLMPMWALSRGTLIPAESVDSIQVVDRRAGGRYYWHPNGMRLPGAYLPGVICAGTYRRSGVRELWAVGRAERAVAITTRDFPVTRVVVQVADPDAVVAAISAALP